MNSNGAGGRPVDSRSTFKLPPHIIELYLKRGEESRKLKEDTMKIKAIARSGRIKLDQDEAMYIAYQLQRT